MDGLLDRVGGLDGLRGRVVLRGRRLGSKPSDSGRDRLGASMRHGTAKGPCPRQGAPPHPPIPSCHPQGKR